MKIKVAVGMSGGVDSSVTAWLLKEKGYEVIGLFMKNWDDSEDGHCPAEKDYQDALQIAEHIKIPLYAFNFSKEYWDTVFSEFLKELKLGYTPNPDILCNREIKFKVFFEKALQLGADFLATGHYARIGTNFQLLKALDPSKDQTYFLYTLKKNLLQKILFPIGDFPKSQIRAMADQAGLVTHDKKDSTGICFIGKRKFKEFIQKYIPPTKGLFLTPEGEVVGEHQGAAYYTIGQRKGLGIGGPGDPWFVVDKNTQTETVTVVQGEDHPLLYKPSLIATDLTWIDTVPSTPFACRAKIRYRQEDQPCIIESIENGCAKVAFLEPQRAITPRQSIVFYAGDTCLGGALIA